MLDYILFYGSRLFHERLTHKIMLNITKEALSCLDKLDGSCKKIITNVGICSNNFIKNNKNNKNKNGEMVTISYTV